MPGSDSPTVSGRVVAASAATGVVRRPLLSCILWQWLCAHVFHNHNILYSSCEGPSQSWLWKLHPWYMLRTFNMSALRT